MSDKKFFESRWIVAKKYLIYFFFAILSMVIMAIGDDTGLGLIFIPIFLVIAFIMTFYFIFMSVNKTTPLIEVDVEGVEPMTSVTPMRLPRREDVVTDGDQAEAVLKNAPDAREGFFAVPKVVE